MADTNADVVTTGRADIEARYKEILTTEDPQLVSVVSLPVDSELKFNLVGSPEGDPGLDFKKG